MGFQNINKHAFEDCEAKETLRLLLEKYMQFHNTYSLLFVHSLKPECFRDFSINVDRQAL